MENFKEQVKEQFLKDFIDGIPDFYLVEPMTKENAKIVTEEQLREMLKQDFAVNYVADTYLLAILNIGGVETIITPLME